MKLSHARHVAERLRFRPEVAAASHRSADRLAWPDRLIVSAPVRAEVTHSVGSGPREQHLRALRQKRRGKFSETM